MHSFYIESGLGVGETAALLPEEARHAARVLRMKPGDALCAMDGGGGRFRAEVEAVCDGAVSVRLLEALDANEAPVRLSVYQGMPKSDKLELVVQKLTELGAAALVPVRMARSVAKLDARDGQKRRERLERIAREATKQCGRGLAPEVCLPLAWKDALERMRRHDLLLVPWEAADGTRMRDALAAHPDARDIGIVIGPEGGIASEEIDDLLNAGAASALTVTLGPRILRTETAAIAAATLAMALWGDL